MSRLLSAASLLVLVAAGCGGAAAPQRASVPGVPRALAHEWEARAWAIAAAASAGNGCHALQLANSLRADVVASKEKLPPRLRPPLLVRVSAIADRITCTPQIAPPKRPKPPHEKHGDHGHRGRHGPGGPKGDGGGGDK